MRSAVAQTGNTPVESSADIQIRTTLSTMGSSIVVVVEQLKDGTVVGSGRQKTPTFARVLAMPATGYSEQGK